MKSKKCRFKSLEVKVQSKKCRVKSAKYNCKINSAEGKVQSKMCRLKVQSKKCRVKRYRENLKSKKCTIQADPVIELSCPSVCLCVCDVAKHHFPVSWRALVEELIPNIGL